MNTKRTFILIIILFALPTNTVFGIETFTKPSADVTLSFVQAGRIAKVNYREGDSVKAGDILVQQDDSVEKVQLEQLLMNLYLPKTIPILLICQQRSNSHVQKA